MRYQMPEASVQHSAQVAAEMELDNTLLSCFELNGPAALERHEARWGRDMCESDRELWVRSYAEQMERFLEVDQ